MDINELKMILETINATTGLAKDFGTTLDLADRRAGVLRCDGRQTSKAPGIGFHGFGKHIVGFGGKLRPFRRVEDLHPRRGQRQDGLVDAALVHLRDAPVTDVEQAVEQEVAVRLEGVLPVVHPAAAGGRVIGTMQIIDRCDACVSLDVPNVSLVEYKAPPNFPAASCPMCAAHVPITAF